MTKQEPIEPATEHLITELLTRVGIIMEDASVVALVNDPSTDGLDQRIKKLEGSSAALRSLVNAARALHEGC